MKRPQHIKQRNDEIYKKHLTGWSLRRIGIKFGISYVRVTQILETYKNENRH
jgi:hypothetical protein